MAEKRLIIITGKGGVGKTTLGLSIAEKEAAAGKKVLLIQSEIQSSGHCSIATVYKKEIGFNKTELTENFSVCSVTPFESLEEYITEILHIPKIVFNLLLKSRIIKSIFEAIPGIREIFLLGKIWHEAFVKKNNKNRSLYDIVIWDAPQAGLIEFYLTLPQLLIRSLKVGPIVTASREIQRDLENPELTELILVAIPEEMALSETNELLKKLRVSSGIFINRIFMNQLYGEIGEKEKQFLSLFNSTEMGKNTQKINAPEISKELIKRIKFQTDLKFLQKNNLKSFIPEEHGCKLIRLPFIFPEDSNPNVYNSEIIRALQIYF